MHGCRGLDFRYVLHRRYLKSSEERFYVHAIFGGKQMSCLPPVQRCKTVLVETVCFARLQMVSFAHDPTNQCCDSETTHHDKKAMGISTVLNHRCMLQFMECPHVKKGACPQ